MPLSLIKRHFIQWKGHGTSYVGSSAIWMAVIGPDTPTLGEIKITGQWWQNQIAGTTATFLGLEYKNEKKAVGKVILEMFEE